MKMTFGVIEDVLEVLSPRIKVFWGRFNAVRALRPSASFQSWSEGRIMMSNATFASSISICFAFRERENRNRDIGRLEGESRAYLAYIIKGAIRRRGRGCAR